MQKSDSNFWDETEPFGQDTLSSKHLRLPSDIIPSFYRLKKKIDLDNSNFSGTVYITIKANKNIDKIILHSKNLDISDNIRLSEQIYEKLETLHTYRSKREADNVNTSETVTEKSISGDVNNSTPTTLTDSPSTTGSNLTQDDEINSLPTHITQVTHTNVRSIVITSVSKEALGDHLILTLESHLKPDIDYILEISFNGTITESLTGLYKSSYLDTNNNRKYVFITILIICSGTITHINVFILRMEKKQYHKSKRDYKH